MSHDANNINPPPRDALDGMLREWHAVNAVRASAGRDRLIEALREGADATRPASASSRDRATADRAVGEQATIVHSFRRFVMHRYTRAAACLALLAGLLALFVPTGSGVAIADAGIVQVPDGGRLEAVDEQGNVLGPCPLKHTDVNATISGPFSRVVVKQTYTNPYPAKIEAVYTFPLSARGAVDRMTMTVGERVVVGEVKERQKARQMYEQARESGYVASLLEQERPNIFTQSIANIEPGATVEVEIAYVEMLQSQDGEHSFDFPMVVGPRYIPGYKQPLPGGLPEGFTARRGVVLLGPASVTVNDAPPVPGDEAQPAAVTLAAGEIDSMLRHATAIAMPSPAWWENARSGKVSRTAQFTVAYADGSKELGELYNDRSGQLNGRWFFCPPTPRGNDGTGFAPDTNLVPDASKITPMPVRPPNRAGHDISVTVNIDSGGAPITEVKSELHEVTRDGRVAAGGLVDGIGGRRATIALRNQKEIPNRDFILKWRTPATDVQEGVFTHVDEREGGFVTVVIDPPARVADTMVRPRELVFVLDTSGSMGGFPIEKAKQVMSRAIDAMRPQDTFNLITFAGNTAILWPEPRPATQQNRAEAQQFLASRQGGGGTEMMKAIEAALKPTSGPAAALDAMALANLPADGRVVTVVVPMNSIGQHGERILVKASDTVSIPLTMSIDLPTVVNPEGVKVRLVGDWTTVNGERQLRVREAGFVDRGANAPMRICMFLTDGYVGNDQAIVQAIRDNAGSTRVFSFGIGNSVNRYLLEQMSLAGRGAVEFVTLAEGADQVVERFARRIQNPVLTDIAIGTAGFELGDIVAGSPSTAPGVLLPDLYDEAPIMFHARVKTPGKGQLVVSGKTGSGPWEKRIDVDVSKPNPAADNPALPVLWARSKVESTLAPHLQAVEQQTLDPAVRKDVIALGERFGISTPFTSFVAVEKSRVTLGGKPMLVAVPVELPQGTRFEGFFGDALRRPGDPRAWRESMLSAVREPETAVRYFGVAHPEQRLQLVNENITRIRQLQMELKYDEAMKVVGETLFVDAHNPAVLALRDVIASTELYRNAADIERRRGYAYAQVGGSSLGEAGSEKEKDGRAAGDRSASGVMESPTNPAQVDKRVDKGEGVATGGAPITVVGAAGNASAQASAKPGHAAAAGEVAKSVAPTGSAAPPSPPPPPAPAAASDGKVAERLENEVLARLSKIPTDSGYFESRLLRDGAAASTARGGAASGSDPRGPTGGIATQPGGGVATGFPTQRPRSPTELPGLAPASASSTNAPHASMPVPSSGTSAPTTPGASPVPAPTSVHSVQPRTTLSAINVRDLRSPGSNLEVGARGRITSVAAPGGDRAGGSGGGGGFGGAIGGGGGSIFGSPADAPSRYWPSGSEQPMAWSAIPASDRGELLRNVVVEVVSPEHWTEFGGTLVSSVVLEDKVAYIAAVDNDQARKIVADATAVQETLLKALEQVQPAADGAATARMIPMPSIVRRVGPNLVDGTAPKVASLVIYDVADLVASREGVPSPDRQERFSELVDVVQEFVAPNDWHDVGGDEASIRTLSSMLVISAPAVTHAGVQALLAALRQVMATGAGPAARVEIGDLWVFDLSALTKGEVDAADRIRSIVELVEPDSWMNSGGDAGHFEIFNGVLVVRHSSPAVRRRVAVLIDQLHASMGVPLPAERQEAVDKAQSMATPLPVSTDGSAAHAIVVYDIADIAGKIASDVGAPPPFGVAIASTRLAELIPGGVLPSAWNHDGEPDGRTGQSIALAGVLVIVQTPSVQIAVDEAMNGFRASLGLGQKALALAPALAPRVPEIRAQLAEEPKAQEARLERINTLFSRLDGPLFARAVEIEDPHAKLVDRSKLEAPAAPGDASFAVNVLVDDPNAVIVDAARNAGLSIESRNDRMKILVGWLPPTKLIDVALVDGVRRIEWLGRD